MAERRSSTRVREDVLDGDQVQPDLQMVRRRIAVAIIAWGLALLVAAPAIAQLG